ncbi:protein transport protein SEC31-like [Melanotaenia boesemani]|uniref:protein transport protein SEC31-like n=1 Tax=Melanotaenia boesemani TaxID=1250792 RepID=UPI001C03DB1C|nr:protein transport protein SEC31-like [Melanotaenia boesemani]XP_041841588.1 protein transport protein SEC31-like [Melanotaenia boesemani]XP_041841589.1 protein transport protein SEC31-like [Melanotaenia boesemani]
MLHNYSDTPLQPQGSTVVTIAPEQTTDPPIREDKANPGQKQSNSWNEGIQHTPQPPMLSFYADNYSTPVRDNTLPRGGAPKQILPPGWGMDSVTRPRPQQGLPAHSIPMATHQVCDFTPHITTPGLSSPPAAHSSSHANPTRVQHIPQPTTSPPADPPRSGQPVMFGPQGHVGALPPTPLNPAPQVSFHTSPTTNHLANTQHLTLPISSPLASRPSYQATPSRYVNYPSSAEQQSSVEQEPTPQFSVSGVQGSMHCEPPPKHLPSARTWAPDPSGHIPQAAAHGDVNQITPFLPANIQHIQPPAPHLYPSPYPCAQVIPPPTFTSTPHPQPSVEINTGAFASQGITPAVYGGFVQTHQVKNVQIFTGNADSKILVEDWIRDIQYLLEAIDLPAHLRFSTVVRHLGGEARQLVLNLPPHDQTSEKAFGELRAEYSDAQGSLDPLADFYERTQKSGESPCSYAIALEATLRAVEESQRGGRPFPDRDSKLTRQLLRGLIDEDVYARIAPMKPRLLSFRELQAELRNLARESKRFQPQHKVKKTYAQVHVTPEVGGNAGAVGSKRVAEIAELTEIVKKLALNQEQQMAKLSHLESRIALSPTQSPRTAQSSSRTLDQNSNVRCYRCGKGGHIARVCRAVFSDSDQDRAHQTEPVTPVEGNPSSQSQHLTA